MSPTATRTEGLPLLVVPGPGTAFLLSLSILRCEASGVAAVLTGAASGVERGAMNRDKKVKGTGRITEQNEGRMSVQGCQYKMVPQ